MIHELRMNQIKNINYNLIFFINLSFCTFPLAYVLGNMIINLNILIFCILGMFHLKKKIFQLKPDLFLKAITIFFSLVVLSTVLININIFKLEGLENSNVDALLKSAFFFRFLLLIIIIYLLNYYESINFKYFFYSAAFFSIIVSLDVIYQYIFGYNVLGFEGNIQGKYPGMFGKEGISGAFIERFSYFAIFLIFYITRKKKYLNLFVTLGAIYVLSLGLLFSGNRMQLVLFIIGLLFTFIIFKKLRKIISFSLTAFLITGFFIFSSDNAIKENYYSFYSNSKHILLEFSNSVKNLEKNKNTNESLNEKPKTLPVLSGHKYLFLTAIDTWELNKTFGGGIKSFRKDCEKILAVTVDRMCSNHPHQYYLEIITETGIVGFIFFIIIVLFFLRRSLQFILIWKNQINEKNLFLLACIISLGLEFFPLRSTGSFFSTNSATFIFLTLSIIVASKNILTQKLN